jgi:hypothetical protein
MVAVPHPWSWGSWVSPTTGAVRMYPTPGAGDSGCAPPLELGMVAVPHPWSWGWWLCPTPGAGDDTVTDPWSWGWVGVTHPWSWG